MSTAPNRRPGCSAWAPLIASSALAFACTLGGLKPTTEPEKLSFIKGPAGKLRVSDGGRGEPALVLIHGLGSSWEVWRHDLAHLRDGHRAVALDLRGHGESAAPADEAGYSIDGMAADLRAVVKALKLPRVVLVGHSMAGAVMTRYAALHPDEVAGLVYVDAIGDWHKLPPEAQKAPDPNLDQQKFYQEILGDKALPATRAAVLEAANKMAAGAFYGMRKAFTGYQASADAEKYTGPAACIDTGADYPVLAHAMIARCQRTSLPGTSHWLMLDDPAGFAKALDAALGPMK